jgi:hypothetical protein
VKINHHLPTRTCTPYEIEELAWFPGWKFLVLTLMVQLNHDSSQDIKHRQASNTTVVEGQHAQSSPISLVWLQTGSAGTDGFLLHGGFDIHVH